MFAVTRQNHRILYVGGEEEGKVVAVIMDSESAWGRFQGPCSACEGTSYIGLASAAAKNAPFLFCYVNLLEPSI